MGEQNLRRVDIMRGKRIFISLSDAHLTDGGGGLQFVERLGAARPAQPFDALGNGAAGHKNHLHAALVELGDLRCPLRQRLLIDTPRPSAVTKLEPTFTTNRRACDRFSMAFCIMLFRFRRPQIIGYAHLLPVLALPKIAPHKSGKGKNQIKAEHGYVKCPILRVHRAGARFEHISQHADQAKAARQLQK